MLIHGLRENARADRLAEPECAGGLERAGGILDCGGERDVGTIDGRRLRKDRYPRTARSRSIPRWSASATILETVCSTCLALKDCASH
jgi:hypothetical protein